VAAPHTYGGSVATWAAIAENHGGILCGLEMILCPRTVLFKGVAEPVWLASEGQARERGSTRTLCATIATGSGARAGVQSKARALG
jgi:hypothetical protein